MAKDDSAAGNGLPTGERREVAETVARVGTAGVAVAAGAAGVGVDVGDGDGGDGGGDGDAQTPMNRKRNIPHPQKKLPRRLYHKKIGGASHPVIPEDRKIGSECDHIFHLSGISWGWRGAFNGIAFRREIPDRRKT